MGIDLAILQDLHRNIKNLRGEKPMLPLMQQIDIQKLRENYAQQAIATGTPPAEVFTSYEYQRQLRAKIRHALELKQEMIKNFQGGAGPVLTRILEELDALPDLRMSEWIAKIQTHKSDTVLLGR